MSLYHEMTATVFQSN